MEVIAHRGASLRAPENTLRAFELAIEEGADRIELDLQRSADGQIFVCHDVSLKRLTGVDAWACDLTLQDLQSLAVLPEVHEANPADSHIPSLAQVVDQVADRCPLYCEIKVDGAGRHTGDLEHLIYECLKIVPRGRNHLIGSFDLHVVRRCLEAGRPTVLIAADPRQLDRLSVGERRRLAAVSVLHERIDAQLTARCAEFGLTLYAWTLDREKDWQRLSELGATAGWCTNDVAGLRTWLARHGAVA